MPSDRAEIRIPADREGAVIQRYDVVFRIDDDGRRFEGYRKVEDVNGAYVLPPTISAKSSRKMRRSNCSGKH